jgi:hypothetical protein
LQIIPLPISGRHKVPPTLANLFYPFNVEKQLCDYWYLRPSSIVGWELKVNQTQSLLLHLSPRRLG